MPPIKGFRGLKPEQKAQVVDEAIQLYLNGHSLENIAPRYGTSARSLLRLISSTDPKGWWAAQHVKQWCSAEEIIEAGVFRDGAPRDLRKKLKRADWRLDRIAAKRHRFFET